MIGLYRGDFREMEKVLADGIKEVASDLRLVDAADLIGHVKNSRLSNIESLVQSSVELYFEEGTLVFDSNAEVSVDWGAAPTILIDLLFRHHEVCVSFSLVLEACRAGVRINRMSGEIGGELSLSSERLAALLADARLKQGLVRSSIPKSLSVH